MSVLKFTTYTVNEMSYQQNPVFQPKASKVQLNPDIQASNEIVGDDTILVSLRVSAGSVTAKNAPFKASVSITGTFEYRPSEDTDDLSIDTFVKHSAVAILYPYVRTLMSNLTLASNEHPAYLLPTINVDAVLEQNK